MRPLNKLLKKQLIEMIEGYRADERKWLCYTAGKALTVYANGQTMHLLPGDSVRVWVDPAWKEFNIKVWKKK